MHEPIIRDEAPIKVIQGDEAVAYGLAGRSLSLAVLDSLPASVQDQAVKDEGRNNADPREGAPKIPRAVDIYHHREE